MNYLEGPSIDWMITLAPRKNSPWTMPVNWRAQFSSVLRLFSRTPPWWQLPLHEVRSLPGKNARVENHRCPYRNQRYKQSLLTACLWWCCSSGRLLWSYGSDWVRMMQPWPQQQGVCLRRSYRTWFCLLVQQVWKRILKNTNIQNMNCVPSF